MLDPSLGAYSTPSQNTQNREWNMSRQTRASRSESEAAARQAVVAAARAVASKGLSPGRTGNVSRRWRDGMLITPSGLAFGGIDQSDIVFVDVDGTPSGATRRPSSEWRFHLAAYAARPDRGAIVHTHSLHATVLACARQPIPAFHYMVAAAGGADIPCIPYATFGTPQLSALVVAGLADRDACLMANHGQIALGADLATALELSETIEVLAEQYYKVLTLGVPHILEPAEMTSVIEKFKTYGQKAQG